MARPPDKRKGAPGGSGPSSLKHCTGNQQHPELSPHRRRPQGLIAIGAIAAARPPRGMDFNNVLLGRSPGFEEGVV